MKVILLHFRIRILIQFSSLKTVRKQAVTVIQWIPYTIYRISQFHRFCRGLQDVENNPIVLVSGKCNSLFMPRNRVLCQRPFYAGKTVLKPIDLMAKCYFLKKSNFYSGISHCLIPYLITVLYSYNNFDIGIFKLNNEISSFKISMYCFHMLYLLMCQARMLGAGVVIWSSWWISSRLESCVCCLGKSGWFYLILHCYQIGKQKAFHVISYFSLWTATLWTMPGFFIIY